MTKTKIEWADRVWNPVTGCTKVSAGCANCYAERHAKRFWGDRKFTDVIYHDGRLTQPLHWQKPSRVFVNSMSDLFHPDVDFDYILRVWMIMERSKLHKFIILTKRPERMRIFVNEWLPGAWGLANKNLQLLDKPLQNVWLGVSIENQQTADERIPLLLKTPAAKRIVSFEPALGPVDFRGIEYEKNAFLDSLDIEWDEELEDMGPKLDWVIMGGESGPGARPMHPDWARSVRDQCQAAWVPFFFKQFGEWIHETQVQENMPIHAVSSKRMMADDKYKFIKVGKKHTGHILDGKEHLEFPGV